MLNRVQKNLPDSVTVEAPPARAQSPGAWRRAGRWRWLLAPSWSDGPLRDSLDRPESWLEPPAVLVDRDPPRTTATLVRLDWAPGAHPALFIKRYLPATFRQRIKDCFRPSRAAHAFALARLLRSIGLPTARALAAGEVRVGPWLTDSFLVTEEVGQLRNWEQFEAQNPGRQTRLTLIRAFARTLARLHDAALTHGDPARPNFLVRPLKDNACELVLIDLDGVRRHAAVSEGRSRKNLEHAVWRLAASRRERLWFLAEYARSRAQPVSARELERSVFRSLGQALARERGSREFGTRQAGGMDWQVRKSLLHPGTEAVLRAPDSFLEQARVLKPSRSSAVSARNGLVLKRDNYRKWLSRFKDVWRGSRARRSFRKAYLLEQAGISTARAIAAATCMEGGLVRRSYLLMEEIPGAVSLEQVPSPRSIPWTRAAELLARLHDAGFCHRDLKGGNIVFDRHGQPHLIDLDGLRYVEHTPDAVAAADLRRLHRHCTQWSEPPSRTERLRFLQRYCRRRKRVDWRWWWNTVATARGE